MSIISREPFTGEIKARCQEITSDEVLQKIQKSDEAFEVWRKTTFDERSKLVRKIGELLRENREVYTALIAEEMGMPVSQGMAEIEKTAQLCEYYADNSEEFLKNKPVDIGARESYIKYDPLGIILHVAPWNFPFLLALRPAIPAIMAGNTILLKHASVTPRCSLALEALFLEAGFPKGVFQSLMVGSSQVEAIIRDSRVRMVTVIGSERAGSAVAKVAGEELKKTVMELGGNDPLIVLADADLDKVFPSACDSRLRNAGQSCNAAKRFVVAEEVADEFLERMKEGFKLEVPGNPLERKTTLGPVASENALNDIKSQVEESVKAGAEVLIGGHGDFYVSHSNFDEFRKEYKEGFFYPPTILTNVNKYMPAYREEIFGPVAAVTIVQSVEEALLVANDSDYGLGSSLWTEDYELANKLIPEIEAGNVFVNSMVRSNIKMPYGGVKKSGYGREMGEDGIKEFVNIKTVVIQ